MFRKIYHVVDESNQLRATVDSREDAESLISEIGNAQWFIDIDEEFEDASDSDEIYGVYGYEFCPCRSGEKLGKCSRIHEDISTGNNPGEFDSTVSRRVHLRFGDVQVRRSLARDFSTPVHTLSLLSNDPDKFVRLACAQNPFTPTQRLMDLATDEDLDVRNAVRRNKNVPSFWVECVSPDTQMETLKRIAQSTKRTVRILVAKNPNLSLEIQSMLSKDPLFAVRETLAANHSCHLDVLVNLSRDESQYVRIAVTLNPKTPPEILMELSLDKVQEVRKIAEARIEQDSNPNCELDFEIGDKVFHKIFGEGIVTGVNDSNELIQVTIIFHKRGRKTIVGNAKYLLRIPD